MQPVNILTLICVAHARDKRIEISQPKKKKKQFLHKMFQSLIKLMNCLHSWMKNVNLFETIVIYKRWTTATTHNKSVHLKRQLSFSNYMHNGDNMGFVLSPWHIFSVHSFVLQFTLCVCLFTISLFCSALYQLISLLFSSYSF